MKQRTITAFLIVLIFTPLLIFEKMLIPFQIAVGLLAMLAVYELIKMFEKTHPLSWFAKVAIFIFTAGFYVLVGNVWRSSSDLSFGDIATDTSLIFMFALLFLFTLSVVIPSFDGQSLGIALIITTYIGLGFGSIVLLRLVGVRYIVYLLMVAVLTDTFAYLFGVKFGKHKMAPNISPKKSWEGAIAGTVIATVIASLFGIFYGQLFPAGSFFNQTGQLTIIDGITNFGLNSSGSIVLWKHALLIVPLTFVLSIVGQLGDLFASKLKRSYEIKDFGEIFPGHGGVLDRFDSTIFAAVFLVFCFRIMEMLW